MHVHTLQLTDEELRILQSSIHSWVDTFTHDQPDLLRTSKLLRERIDTLATAANAVRVSTLT